MMRTTTDEDDEWVPVFRNVPGLMRLHFKLQAEEIEVRLQV